jgi:hypothetical protein
MSYNTYITYEGDGSTLDFAIPFSYLKQDDVVVTRQNGPVSYVFLNPNTIRVSTAIDVGDRLLIERRTNILAPSVVYQNGSSFTGDNVNRSFDQLRYAVQETVDRVGTVYARVYDIASIDSAFNGVTTTFRLDSGGANLGDKVYDPGLWQITMNGVTLEPGTDYSIGVVDTVAKITFVEAPQASDNSLLKFIRFYDGTYGGGGGGDGTGAQILDDLNDVAINNPVSGHVLSYNGTTWTNVAGSTVGGGTGGGDSGIDIVTSTPNSCSIEGKPIYNTTDGKLYICENGAYVDIFSAYTPAAPDAIEIVNTLPATATDGDVVFNQADNKLYKRVNGAWVEVVSATGAAATVADGSITTAKFAQGIRPVEIVSTLPTTGNVEGRLVYLTTDDKLYRYDGTNFVTGINGADLTGTIGANQIAANAITVGKVAAGAIGASEIASGAISTDKLAAGAITSEKITALAVTSAKIAADAITTDKIAANAITAGKIQAAAIGTSQLASGAITADKLAANQVLIGTAQIADANITTLKVAGNAITQAQAFTKSKADVPVGSSYQTVLSGSVTVSGTQPVIVMAAWNSPNQRTATSADYDFYQDGYYWKVNGYLTGQDARISLGGYTSDFEGVTLGVSESVGFAYVAMFNGVPAGTYTLSLQLRRQPSSLENAVRYASMVMLETKR